MYSPEKYNLQHMPSFTFGVKSNLEKPNQNPGNNNNRFRLVLSASKHPLLNAIQFHAGPTAYAVEKVNLESKKSFSFGLKIKQEKYSDTPGTFEQTRKHKRKNQHF